MLISEVLSLLLLSFVATALASVPFINLLYHLKFQRQKEVHVLSPVLTKLHAWKVGTPNSGGVLVIVVLLILGFAFANPGLDPRTSPGIIIILALVSYGLLGLYDDVKKYFGYQKEAFWGMRLRYKLILQIGFALGLGYLLWQLQSLSGLVTVNTFLFGSLALDQWTYTIFSALVIVATANAVNITDGVDGLSSGLLIMTLLSLIVIATATSANYLLPNYAGMDLMVPLLAIWIGSLLAFLYFNIHPARMWMGDSGALAFGAALAVTSLLLSVPLLLLILGAVYAVETASSLLQWYSMRFMSHKLFIIAPIHHHFEALGWPETKVTMRFWVAGALSTLTGLLIFFKSHGL